MSDSDKQMWRTIIILGLIFPMVGGTITFGFNGIILVMLIVWVAAVCFSWAYFQELETNGRKGNKK